MKVPGFVSSCLTARDHNKMFQWVLVPKAYIDLCALTHSSNDYNVPQMDVFTKYLKLLSDLKCQLSVARQQLLVVETYYLSFGWFIFR